MVLEDTVEIENHVLKMKFLGVTKETLTFNCLLAMNFINHLQIEQILFSRIILPIFLSRANFGTL